MPFLERDETCTLQRIHDKDESSSKMSEGSATERTICASCSEFVSLGRATSTNSSQTSWSSSLTLTLHLMGALVWTCRWGLMISTPSFQAKVGGWYTPVLT